MLTNLAAAILASSPAAIPAAIPAGAVPITECVAGESIIIVGDDGVLYPGMVTKATRPGFCMVRAYEHLTAPPVEGPFRELLRGTRVPAPSAEALALGSLPALNVDQERRLRNLALNLPGDALIFVSRFALSRYDDTIVARICTPDESTAACRRGKAQFYADFAAGQRQIDADNRAQNARDRAARAASQPVNSGYYQSGAYAADVAASRNPGAAASAPRPTTAPVRVQSETEIRRSQDQCRRGSGAC